MKKGFYLLLSIIALIAFAAAPAAAVDSLPIQAGFSAGLGVDYTGLKLTSGGTSVKADLVTAYVNAEYDAKLTKNIIVGIGANIGAGALHMKLDQHYVGDAFMVAPKIKAAYLLSPNFQAGVVGTYEYVGKTDDKLMGTRVEAGAINMFTVKPTLQWTPIKGLAIFGGGAMRFASMGNVKSPYVNVAVKVKDSFGGGGGISYDIGSFTIAAEGQGMSNNGSGGAATLTFRFWGI